MALAELGAELGIRAGRARFARGTASSPISVSSLSSPSSRAGTPCPTSPSASPSAGDADAPSSGSSTPPSAVNAARPSTPPHTRTRTPPPSTSAAARTPAPSNPSRPRAVPVYSPLAATANTPPRSPASGKMYKIHPFFLRRAAPVPHPPRCIADYTSTSESGSSVGDESFSSLGSPCSPLDARAVLSQASQASPIPATRVVSRPMVSSPVQGTTQSERQEDAAGRRAARLAAAVKARQEARKAADPSEAEETNEADEADKVADAIAGLDLNGGGVPPAGNAASEPTDAPPDTMPRPKTPPRLLHRRYAKPGDEPYFSVTRPLPGHFDRPPNVVYTRNADEADDLVACLRGPLGFDLEWPPPGIGPVLTRTNQDGTVRHYRRGMWDPLAKRYVWPQGRTAVVQVADARTVVVYHLPINGVLGPGIQAVLNDPGRAKLGVNIISDARKLHRDELIDNTSGLLDLSHIAHRIDPEVWTHSSRLISLARLTHHYLGVPLDKTEGIREGAWSNDLNAEQIEYAANDAFVGVLIYNAMARRAAERGRSADLELLREQSSSAPQFLSPAYKLATNTKDHPAVVAATRAGAKPRQTLALGLFVAGGSVAELAASLRISTRTVQGYVAEAALLIPPDEYEDYVDLAVRLCEAFPVDSYPAVRHVEFFSKLRRIASAVDREERVPVHHVEEYEWGPDY